MKNWILFRRLIAAASGATEDSLELDVKDGEVLEAEIIARHKACGFQYGLVELLEVLRLLSEWQSIGKKE